MLTSTPAQTRLVTGADFDPDAFERIWKSEAVQRAASSYGWRGLAEAVWAAAFEVARGTMSDAAPDSYRITPSQTS